MISVVFVTVISTGVQAAGSGNPGTDASVVTAVTRARVRLDRLEWRIEQQPESMSLRMERLGHLYVLGVEDPSFLDDGDAEIARIRVAHRNLDPALDARLNAYGGAYEVVRAKHASWPFNKLSHANRGLTQLDAAVRAQPRDAVIRYLRLTSCFSLPFFFSRGESIAEDTEVLATLLADGTHALSSEDALTMAVFLLDEAELTNEMEEVLIAAFQEPADGR